MNKKAQLPFNLIWILYLIGVIFIVVIINWIIQKVRDFIIEFTTDTFPLLWEFSWKSAVTILLLVSLGALLEGGIILLKKIWEHFFD